MVHPATESAPLRVLQDPVTEPLDSAGANPVSLVPRVRSSARPTLGVLTVAKSKFTHYWSCS